ncbi:MAG: hypothetical protein V7739_19880 [Motiliproteus sp.]
MSAIQDIEWGEISSARVNKKNAPLGAFNIQLLIRGIDQAAKYQSGATGS